MQIVALSGHFKFTGATTVNVVEQAVHYIAVGAAGSFRFTGGSVVFRRVIPKVRGKGRNK